MIMSGYYQRPSSPTFLSAMVPLNFKIKTKTYCTNIFLFMFSIKKSFSLGLFRSPLYLLFYLQLLQFLLPFKYLKFLILLLCNTSSLIFKCVKFWKQLNFSLVDSGERFGELRVLDEPEISQETKQDIRITPTYFFLSEPPFFLGVVKVDGWPVEVLL